MDKSYWEDFEIGEKIVSPGRTITEADLVMFAAFTGDWHPIHTDVDYASKTLFGERIAHGMLVLVVGSALGFRLGQYVMMPRSSSFAVASMISSSRWIVSPIFTAPVNRTLSIP